VCVCIKIGLLDTKMNYDTDLFECSIQRWYSDFSEITFKTILLELPDSFKEWILSDGVFVAPQSQAVR
jgi:hypothetical protein